MYICSARVGLLLAIQSIGLLVSGPIQGALLGSNFAWWRPTVFSGVSIFHLVDVFGGGLTRVLPDIVGNYHRHIRSDSTHNGKGKGYTESLIPSRYRSVGINLVGTRRQE